MRIRMTTDKRLAKKILKQLKENDGYCPCELVKNADTKCKCKEFRMSTEPGQCKCGLYIKE